MLMPGSEMANQIRTARATLDNELATGRGLALGMAESAPTSRPRDGPCTAQPVRLNRDPFLHG